MRSLCATLAGDEQGSATAVSWLIRVAALGLLSLLGSTWILFTPQQVFPRVPFVQLFGALPASAVWIGLCGAISALWVLFLSPGRGVKRSVACVSFVALAGLLVLADQHRFQPWIYHLSVLVFVLSVAPPPAAIGMARLLVISIYVYSAVSKLDWTFLESGGGLIGEGLMAVLHLNGDQASRETLAALLPVGELAVAIGLLFRQSRRIALFASLAMHAVLMLALGPLGAGHRPGVMIWNAVFMVQNLILFGLTGNRSPQPEKTADTAARSGSTVPTRVAGIVVAFVALFPVLQPWGYCDTWPAWAVYSTGAERLNVLIDLGDRERLPEPFRRYLSPPRYQDDRCVLRIDRWSLDATGAPIYPQNRYRLGVSLAVARAFGIEKRLAVEVESSANRWTGARSRRIRIGAGEIQAALQADWLNGLPAHFDAR